MNVLSLFDGMSCGQIALKELGFKIDKYYASEIDKHAIAQTKLNFPNTIYLGDVRNVDISKLEPIDLIIGGSPCQNFSFAGKTNGMTTTTKKEVTSLEQYLQLKKDNFEFEGQSYLFLGVHPLPSRHSEIQPGCVLPARKRKDCKEVGGCSHSRYRHQWSVD